MLQFPGKATITWVHLVCVLWRCTPDYASLTLHAWLFLQELRPELLQELSLNACLNGNAFLVQHGDLTEFVGNRTECALLVLAKKLGYNYQKVRLVLFVLSAEAVQCGAALLLEIAHDVSTTSQTQLA